METQKKGSKKAAGGVGMGMSPGCDARDGWHAVQPLNEGRQSTKAYGKSGWRAGSSDRPSTPDDRQA